MASLIGFAAGYSIIDLTKTKSSSLTLPTGAAADPLLSRRTWFTNSLISGTSVATLLVTAPPQMAWADSSSSSNTASSAAKLATFNDATNGFSLSVPSDWSQSEQTISDRRKLLLWRDPSDEATLLFIAYTPVRDDFTSLGSFGSVDEVAAQTIMPKGAMMNLEDDAAAKMISAVSQKQAYFFDYIQSIPAGGGPSTPAQSTLIPTHFRAIFSLQKGTAGNNAGAMLVTMTAQTPEERYSSMKSTFDAIINSYGKSA